MSYYPPPKKQPSTSFLLFGFFHIIIFFCQYITKQTEMALLNIRNSSGHHRLALRVLTVQSETKSNALRMHSNIVSCCPRPTCPFCTSRLCLTPGLLGLPELCPPTSRPCRLIPLRSSATSPASTSEEYQGSPTQTQTTPASKCRVQSVHSPEITHC